MFKFIQNAIEWALEKETEAAEHCSVTVDEVDKQIAMISDKKEYYEKQHQEAMQQFNHLLLRLQAIREKASSCHSAED